MFLDSSPAEEDCAQVGSENYLQCAATECNIYKKQLERLFPIPPNLEYEVSFMVKFNRYESGGYYEAVLRYNDANSDAIKFAFEVENNAPGHWDAEAIAELQEAGLRS